MHKHLQQQLDVLADEPETTIAALTSAGQRLTRRGMPTDEAGVELNRWTNEKALPRLQQLGREAENLALALARTRASTAALISGSDEDAGEGTLSPETIQTLYQGLAHSMERLKTRLDDAWRAIERIEVFVDEEALYRRRQIENRETLVFRVCIAIKDWLTGKQDA